MSVDCRSRQARDAGREGGTVRVARLSGRTEQEIFAHSSLRSLTNILWWAANKVKLAFEFDADGIAMAAWLSPYMSGAEVGVWIRKDKRTAYQSVVFVNRFYKAALQHYPVLIGITQRPELEKIPPRAWLPIRWGD